MKMKKFLAIILAAVMLLGCMSFTAFADGEEELFDETIDFTQQDVSGAIYETIEDDDTRTVKIAAITEISTEHFTIDFSNAFCTKTENKDPHSGEVRRVRREHLEMAAASNITISSTNGKQTITKVEIISDGFYDSVDTGNGPYFTPEDENVTSDVADGNFILSNINSDKISMTSCWDMAAPIQKIRVYYTQSSDPSGVDLSMLETGAKIRFGTQNESPVEWVIGGDGETGMSVPEGCIALVSSDIVASNVAFSSNNNVYAASNLKTVVESAVTFTTDEQAAIKERTLAGNQTYGADCDGVAGDSVTAKVWAPTTKDAYALNAAGLSAVGSHYWLCSPGYFENEAAFVYQNGLVYEIVSPVNGIFGVRAALYLDTSYISGVTAVSGKENTYTLELTAPSTFLTTFTLNKDYNDKYTADTKSTAVNETVSFTITPVTENAPAFDPATFSMTVTDGVGEAEVDLPDLTDVSKVGEYWYEIEETAGTTAGVTYDDATYYLHLIVSYKDGEFGFSSAAIHTTEPVDGVYSDDDKIDTVSNSYGEGTLTVAQETTVNGEASDEDTFKVTVTFTAPTGTTVIGDITYGDDQTVAFENGVGTAVIELKGGESVTFENIPDGVTYTVEQTGKNEDKGYTLDSVSFGDTGETGDDSVSDANVASGTIGDAADTVTITNSKTVPIDVGVILENGAFIVLALGALIAAAWLIVSKRRKSVDAE